MGTEKNLKILQTVLLLVGNLVDRVEAEGDTVGFLVAMAAVMVEEVVVKEGIQGEDEGEGGKEGWEGF